ncbi:hypothetical protein H6G89_04140 [Oscillatoria sp. FACHB-1407]|uniref:hypothetical protein n=1 Tax=Oscillatoria sp. FACHB-1407 TaxID=2692847 RepID=UPI001686E1F5|nr:hypothetical protein [Oscillatoria sp. FACHB-1407]MBD2460227.1 hypothetical protein [Oscillatoria sp. FACHB-1407]
MPDEQHDESLGVEQLPQDELEATPQSDETVSVPNADHSEHIATDESSTVDTEEPRDSKQPRRIERDRRIATD